MLGLTTVLQLGLSVPQQTPAAIGPVLTAELGLSRAELGLLTSAIWGGMLLGMFPAGILADRFGERRVIAAGGAALGILIFLASYATSFWALFALLLLAAVGAASGSPGGTRALASWFAVGQRGMAMGIRQTGVTIAGVTAAVVLPPVAVAFDWQAAFRVAAVLVVACVLVFTIFYREPAQPHHGDQAALHLRDLLGNRPFLVATAFAWMFMGALGCSVTYLGVSLHQQAGLSAVEAGQVLAVLQVGGIAGRVGYGLAADRIGRVGPILVLTGVLAVVACGLMALVRGPQSMLLLAGLGFTLGLATMGWNAVYLTLVAAVAPARSGATAIGAALTVSFTGMFVVPPLFGLIADQAGSYPRAWLALALWSGVAAVVGSQLRERRRPAS